MIASIAIGTLLIATGVALLAWRGVWDWARDQVVLRASEVSPPGADHDKIVQAYLKILSITRTSLGPWFLLLGLAALLVMDAQIAGLLGGAALAVAASFVQLFWLFVPAVAYGMASAVLFGGTGLAVGMAVTDTPWAPLGGGLAVAVAATGSRTAWEWIKRTNRVRPPVAFALAILSATLGLGPLFGLLLLFGVPWAWIGGWLALSVASVLVAVWLARRWFRAQR